MLKKQLSKCALLLDSARCHSTKRFTDKLNELQVKKVQIPLRMTNLLQPARRLMVQAVKITLPSIVDRVVLGRKSYVYKK